MPELPEVEVVRRGLLGATAGRLVERVEVLHPRAVRRHLPGAADLAARLTGRRFGPARRRGKYLWIPLGPDEALVAHLGMSGQFRMAAAAAPDQAHLRVRICFADADADGDGSASELRYVDQRTFGGLAIDATGDDGRPCSLAHLAADPFDPAFDPSAVVDAVRRRRTEIKRALLDQTLVSGIGNIYADELLWRGKVHGARPTERLPRRTVLELLDHGERVMNEALVAGGTSFDSLYVNVNGESGYFDRRLDVYGRAGEPCRRCGAPIRRTTFMNRSSYFCPICQPAPRRRP